jgi:hypothetical protein
MTMDKRGSSHHSRTEKTPSNGHSPKHSNHSSTKLSNHSQTSSRTFVETALPPPNRKAETEKQLEGFEDDTRLHSVLRFFGILPPSPNESPMRRRIRILIWWTLILDFTVAIVSIFTFGEVTTCCGDVIFPGKFDWNKLMQVIAYLYLIGIFAEVHPVVREVDPIPWNLLNPVFGFFISFAVFVDDSRAEAISIWILEVASIVLEFVVYRLRKKLYREQGERLTKFDLKISSLSDEEQHAGSSYKKSHLLRERRELRQKHISERANLHIHLIGVAVNISLVCVTLLLIIFVAKSGGMCIRNGVRPSLFEQNQQERCSECQGTEGDCEICNDDGTKICYYPYY